MTTIPLLDLTREYAHVAAEIGAAWSETLRRMRLLDGEQVALFERKIAEYVGVSFARGVASGTDALILGMAAFGIGAGDRVILSANAFIAALEAVYHLGAQPVLVDVAPDSFAPDPETIAAAFPATAVIAVHMYGAALDLEPIMTLCRRNDALLIEDGSHSHGALRRGQRVGSFGDVGCFSAGTVKNLAAYGDAGFVTTRGEAVAREVALLQRHGQRGKNDHVRYGYNSRLDELQAAVLRIKLRHLDTRNQRRREIAEFYRRRLTPLGVRVPEPEANEVPVYHQYVIRTEARDQLRAHLQACGVETGIHYPVPLHRQAAWSRAYGTELSFPEAEKLAGEILSLPIFPDLTDAEVEHVTRAVESFFGTSILTSKQASSPVALPNDNRPRSSWT